MRKIYTPVLLLIIIFVSSCVTRGSSVNIDEVLKLAESGDPVAQLKLGVAYNEGTGVKKNLSEAVRWYKKSAEQGNAEAQNSLGSMYQSGEGVPQDSKEAVKWYKRAANQGHMWAQNSLAIRYLMGQGVKQDSKNAVYWYEESAKSGNVMAIWNLGQIYAAGKDVTKNNVQAYKWLDLARFYTQSTKDMRLKWGVRGDLDKIKEQMSKSEIKEAKQLSREWDRKYRIENQKGQTRLKKNQVREHFSLILEYK